VACIRQSIPARYCTYATPDELACFEFDKYIFDELILRPLYLNEIAILPLNYTPAFENMSFRFFVNIVGLSFTVVSVLFDEPTLAKKRQMFHRPGRGGGGVFDSEYDFRGRSIFSVPITGTDYRKRRRGLQTSSFKHRPTFKTYPI